MPKSKGKRRKRKRSDLVVSLRRGPFPSSIRTKHRYCQTISMSPGIATANTYLFRALGMWRPNQTSTGTSHQPLGFDEYTPIYDHYQVTDAKMTCSFVSGSFASTDACMVGIYVNDDATPVTTYNTVIEQGGAAYRILSPTDAMGVVSVSKKFRTKEFFSVANVRDNENLKGSTTANPADDAYFTIFAQGLSVSTAPTSILVNVVIDYSAVWSEPKSLSQSTV